MNRYIDADKIFPNGVFYVNESDPRKSLDELINRIGNAPTADVVEVRHGEWIEKDDGWDGVLYTCSVCHCDWITIDGTPFENNMRYCPECGAKMDGERREENER